MLSSQLVKKVLDCALTGGADFADIFVEETYSSEISMADSKPAKSLVGTMYGAGLRVFYGHEIVYMTTNDLSEKGLLEMAKTLAGAGSQKIKDPKLVPQQAHEFVPKAFDQVHEYGKRAQEADRRARFDLLKRIDREARSHSSQVTQVLPSLQEKSQKILVANSLGVWAEDERNYVNIRFEAIVEDGGQKEGQTWRTGTLGTGEFFQGLDLEKHTRETVDRALRLVKADFAPAGEMPVIIDDGFGGVIFHEACGHGLETTSVAKKASVFTDKIGQKVAHECVTAIDDGTLANTWGSLQIDDEGRPTQKTVLIENGILKSYLVDEMGARQTGYKATGSGRRQNYKFAPASRMRNTYIAAGNDTLESMIADIDYGIYAKQMGGGSVSPASGDFNFGVQEAYLIRNGKIEKPVRGATLIGRGIDTLGNIVKVGKEVRLEIGMCGSVSGSIPTTVGQPPITVSKILVGGRAS